MNFANCEGSVFCKASKLSVSTAQRLHQPVEHSLCMIGAERADENFARVVDAAFDP